ncbi:MAG: DUF488 domain-containing protein [Candidatus Pacebacteria bacterium]|nr:DUF488 domain-containing protein [Candidatus Paceibacterota bacterium]
MNKIYTIGYASYSLKEFIAVLKKYGINAVADVRTTPYSQFKPEFNKDVMAKELKSNRIYYVPLGKECGARPDNKSCYVNDQVNFDILAATDLFYHGIQRLRNGTERCVIGIMCAEQDPIQCHRYILVARELSKHYPEIEIVNILPNGKIEEMGETESRLLQLYHLDKDEFPGLGKSLDERLKEAYAKQGEKISYHINDKEQEKDEH